MNDPTNAVEPTYPCRRCGKPRTRAEGGTVFTVCDGCWDDLKDSDERKRWLAVRTILDQARAAVLDLAGARSEDAAIVLGVLSRLAEVDLAVQTAMVQKGVATTFDRKDVEP